MRSRINAMVILVAIFIAFTALSNAKGVQTSGHQLPTAVLAAGPGPMCFLDTGCGYRFSLQTGAGKEYSPAAILLADGPGPMCFPHSGCGLKDKTGFRAILLADGPGPMCFPSTGCGYRSDEVNMSWPS
jgi:hypothetical protein